MANPQNLRPFASVSVARERGRKGGLAKAKKQKEKQLLKDTLELLLETGKDGTTVQEQICLSIVKRAKAGDIKAAEFIRDTIGQKPKNETEISGAGGEPLAVTVRFVKAGDNEGR